MKRFFDTSILIAAFYKFHIHHASSAQVFLAASKQSCFCALHTLGEVYAVLTGLPIRPRISGRDGMAIIDQILDRLTVITLREQEYVAVLREISNTIVGGAAYDALIARGAVKSGADVLLTWNPPGENAARNVSAVQITRISKNKTQKCVGGDSIRGGRARRPDGCVRDRRARTLTARVRFRPGR